MTGESLILKLNNMVIYLVTNLINGKKYVGRDAHNRSGYYGGGTAIKNAIKKYGKENFKKEILEQCLNTSHLKEQELWWLNHFNAGGNPEFYNIILSSDGWELGKERPKQQGKHLSEETKQKISQNSKGKTRKSGKPTPVTQYRYEIIKIPIATYPSIQEAAKTTGLNHSDISAVCLKKQITAGGFYWEKQK